MSPINLLFFIKSLIELHIRMAAYNSNKDVWNVLHVNKSQMHCHLLDWCNMHPSLLKSHRCTSQLKHVFDPTGGECVNCRGLKLVNPLGEQNSLLTLTWSVPRLEAPIFCASWHLANRFFLLFSIFFSGAGEELRVSGEQDSLFPLGASH